MAAKSSAAAVLLFSVCLGSFLIRGPCRYLRGEPGDYATNYSAGRCWAKGENPYDHPKLDREFHGAGGPAQIVINQHERGSIYVISAMPFFAAVSWLPWKSATVLWLATSLLAIGVAGFLIIFSLPVEGTVKWLTGSLMLLLCTPTLFGLLAGNPSIPTVGLTIIAAYLAIADRPVLSGICLGIAFSVKPQVAIVAVIALALWRHWRPVLLAVAMMIFATFIGYLRAGSATAAFQWIESLKTNMRLGNAPGEVTDFSAASGVSWQMVNAQAVTSTVFPDHATANLVAWMVCVGLFAAFFLLRLKSSNAFFGRDLAFLACIFMLPVYHRVHDADILLLLVPMVVSLWFMGRRRLAWAIGICMAILFAPTEKIVLQALGTASSSSIFPSLLLHCSAVLVLILTALMTWSAYE